MEPLPAQGAGRPTGAPGLCSERTPIRRISVVTPMFNEAEHVEGLVEDMAKQDFEGVVELLVADGRSADNSVARLEEAARRYGLELTVLDNPLRWVSSGLNLCIEQAAGDLIVRVDCHSRYPSDYLRLCAQASEETGAENVGGVLIPCGRTPMERAVACAMNSPFGGVLWSRHGGVERVETDTVPFGAFRPEVFRAIGLFDEEFVRNQDDEFNLRLRIAGGRIVLDPAIRVYYTPRGSLARVFRQYFEYGYWKPAVMRKHRRPTGVRSLAPLLFILSLAALALATPWSEAARVVLVAECALYVTAAVVFGTFALRRCDAGGRLLPRVIACFPTFHFAYGLGMLGGLRRRVR